MLMPDYGKEIKKRANPIPPFQHSSREETGEPKETVSHIVDWHTSDGFKGGRPYAA